MGLLDILNGMQNGPRGQAQPGKGGMSPLTMAILALLAWKAYKKLGHQDGTLPANTPAPESTGAGGALGGMVGGGIGTALGGLLKGGLGGLLGGAAAGNVISGGLGDLLRQFQQNGHGDIASSWIGTGTNRQISPEDLHQALGDDTVNSLAEQAGISKVQLLSDLSEHLPEAVDEATPHGRLPTEAEVSRMA
jgi:uncharacterized protein YidB (DUF937 family)